VDVPFCPPLSEIVQSTRREAGTLFLVYGVRRRRDDSTTALFVENLGQDGVLRQVAAINAKSPSRSSNASACCRSLGGYTGNAYELSNAGTPAQIYGTRMTPSIFTVLAVAPLMGRVTRQYGNNGQACWDQVKCPCFQPTIQPTNRAVLCDFRVFRQSPRCCKSLKSLMQAD
jgi:hypothetical protein